MKKILIYLFLILSLTSFSQTYNIGDKITLKISGEINREEIKKAFKNYKIYSIKSTDNQDYIIKFTSFKTGKQTISLGNTNINFDITPTIKKNDNKIYSDMKILKNRYKEKQYPLFSIFLGLLGITFLIISIIIFLMDRKKNPYLNFIKQIEKIDNLNWREKISFELRMYIDKVYKTNFLNGEYIKFPELTDEDIIFIQKLDYLKFSTNRDGNQQKYKDRAIEIVEKLRKEKKKNV